VSSSGLLETGRPRPVRTARGRAVSSLLFLLLVAVAQAAPIKWEKTYAHAVALARQAGQPVLVDFEAEWCGWCKLMDKETYGNATVQAALSNVVCVKVDTDRDTDVAQAYQVSSMPRTVLIDQHGRIIGDQSGYMAADRFLPWLRDALARPESQRAELPAAPGLAQVDVMFKIRALDTTTSGWDTVIGYLGHSDRAVREAATAKLKEADASVRPALVKALASPQLGLRIAAWEVLDASASNHPPFDPWAPAAVRTASLAAWTEWARP
jgi:thiol-disulfide isomerase/thioredoxin